MESKRGALTERIKKKSKKLMGYEVGVTELRLMPYVIHVMMNDQRIDPRKCNGDDREILSKWRKKGYIEGGASGLAITKQFWDIITEIVFLSYVDRYEEYEGEFGDEPIEDLMLTKGEDDGKSEEE